MIGGYAVNFHGHHRFTKDIDVWIRVSPENAARMSAALQQCGFNAATVAPAVFLERERIFTFGRVPVRVDILTDPLGVDFGAAYTRRVVAELDGVPVSFIGLSDLRSSKRASGRPKDLDDLNQLPS